MEKILNIFRASMFVDAIRLVEKSWDDTRAYIDTNIFHPTSQSLVKEWMKTLS